MNPVYRNFEQFLHTVDGLSAVSRRRSLVLMTYWLAWAEEITAHVKYIYLDVAIEARRWPIAPRCQVEPTEIPTNNEMNRS